MSKNTLQTSANGDIQSKTQSNAYKNRKKPMKSNITSKMRTRRAEVVTPGNGQDEDDEADSSANEEHDDANEDPDVSALPGAHSQSGGETEEHLAGHKSKDQNEDAVGGAVTQGVMQAIDASSRGSANIIGRRKPIRSR